jgi:peptidoglycan/xylan/chitin deacetylase (PgdA/CDA1 family)
MAVPAVGWEVSEWSVEGCTGTTCTVIMYGDQNVIVTFTEYIEYTLTTSVDPVGSGTIIADPGGPTYPRDTMVRLTVIPASGYFFDHWTGDCAGQGNPCTVTMNTDKTATAYLALGRDLPKNLITTPGTPREGFESLSSWTVSGSGSGYGAVLDTVNVKEGTASIKLTTPASGNVTITKTVAWDLSADQGNIRFWVYDSGPAEPTGGSVILYTNASSYFTASYGGAFKLRYKPGWNLVNLLTSDWKATGSPSWANITSIRIRLDSRTANTYSFDELTSGVVSQPAVIFTFDKSLSSLYTQAFSYMSSHNVRGTGYVITDLPDTTGYARWDQLQAMKAAGWTIGNQTMSNVDLTTLDLAGQTAQLQGAMNALVSRGLDPCHVAYPGGKYNANTLNAMTNLGMCTGRTLMAFNNVSPLASPFEIAQRTIVKSTTLSTAQSWVDTAKARGEILVITIQGLSASPTTNDWYISRFQSLINYCISQGIPIITMDDLYRLQSGGITIPLAR